MAPDWLFISPELLDDPTLQKIISKVAKRESKLIRHRQAQERYRGRLRNSKIQELKLVVCLLSKIQKNVKEILLLRKGNREYRKKLSLIRRLILDYSGALESILYEPQLHSVASNKVGELECGAMDTPEILAKVLLRKVMERLSPLGRIEDMAEICFKSVLDNAAFAASQYDPNTAKVLGWTDQRQVSETEARFMFTKHFPNGDLNGFADRTFDTSLVYEKYRLVQNWVTDMSILQKINENTYLMLRENAAPNTDFQFRTIYLLFRFFADDGNTIVVATKSLEDCIQDSMPNSRMPYIKALYSFVFTKYTPHLSSQNQANAIDVPIASKKGCFVQLGGQVGVGSKSGAKRLISEAIQCALRWENMCVEPLFQFK